jgi:hypothetical protein
MPVLLTEELHARLVDDNAVCCSIVRQPLAQVLLESDQVVAAGSILLRSPRFERDPVLVKDLDDRDLGGECVHVESPKSWCAVVRGVVHDEDALSHSHSGSARGGRGGGGGGGVKWG